jgi:hypothetical protein
MGKTLRAPRVSKKSLRALRKKGPACEVCGASFEIKPLPGGERRKFCSAKCRSIAYYDRNVRKTA